MWASNKYKGFTIVELLIVVVVIAILASIAIVAFTGIQNRALDSRRAQDFSTIKKALLSYNTIHGGVPRTTGPGSYTDGVNYMGWDASTSPNWLAFLRNEHGAMPIDPANILIDNPPNNGNYVYYYHCYEPGSGTMPETNHVRIGYRKSNGVGIGDAFAVTSCL